jgi:hypothetical protein
MGKIRISDGTGRFDNLPDVAKIMHSKGFSCEERCRGEDEIGPKVSQDKPNVELLRFSSKALISHRFRVCMKLGLHEISISQNVLNVFDKASERTLAATKHPSNDTAHMNTCNFRAELIPYNPAHSKIF